MKKIAVYINIKYYKSVEKARLLSVVVDCCEV